MARLCRPDPPAGTSALGRTPDIRDRNVSFSAVSSALDPATDLGAGRPGGQDLTLSGHTGCSYDTISQFFSREASLLRNQELEQI